MDQKLVELPDCLFSILRHYATLRSPRSLKFPLHLSFDEVHGFFLRHILLNAHFVTYPPSKQYSSVFWKWAIDGLETMSTNHEDAEIDGRIYGEMTSLMSGLISRTMSGLTPPTESYCTYIWKTPNIASGGVLHELSSATVLESRTLIANGTTGLTTWAASLRLAEYLITHSEIVRGRTVLELGCGVGLLGIVAATIQLRSCEPESADGPNTRSALYLSDVNDVVLRRCLNNIKLPCNDSSRHPNIRCQTLDWSDTTDPHNRAALVSLFREMNADVLLGADIVYDPGIIPILISTICLAMETSRDANKSLVIYIALTVRNEETVALFLQTAEEFLKVKRLQLEVVGEHSLTEIDDAHRVVLYEMSLPA